MFRDRVLLITGGTGSFGNAVLKRFLNSDLREIRIFSRDEKKQDDMRTALLRSEAEVLHRRCARFRAASASAMRGVDYCLSCRCPEAGAVLRVLSDGGGAHQRARHGKRARSRDRQRA